MIVAASFCLLVSTPEAELEFDPVQHMRFLGHDGWRGLLPGHEPARAILLEGPLSFVTPGEVEAHNATRWVATEGGLVLIDRRVVRVLTRWAAVADSLEQLRGQVEVRDATRGQHEREARALAHRHEIATRRALSALERKVTMP